MAAATCLSVIRPVAVCLIDGLRSVTAKSGKALLELVVDDGAESSEPEGEFSDSEPEGEFSDSEPEASDLESD